MQNTWADGLDPKYVPMDKDQSKLFVTGVMMEMEKNAEMDRIMDEKLKELFLIRILNGKLERFNLPLHFTVGAKTAALALTKTPGDMVVLIIDCLNYMEKYPQNEELVTTGILANIYPWGFYDEPTMDKYVDEYMKPRKVKWSDVYVSR